VKLDLSKTYRILAPRIVSLITSVNKMGGIDAAPVSFVSPVSFKPAIVMVSLMPVRHTYKNITANREFVINILSKGFADRVLKCAARYPEGVNKLEVVGLHWYSSERVKVPRIKEAKVWLECKFLEEKRIGDHIVIFAEVLAAEAKDDVITEGEVDLAKVSPIMHIGRDKFATDFRVVKYKRYD
jgi:flavin reductase (DIM6/NTAB) family NADH-FMN oxidoreductase RutF